MSHQQGETESSRQNKSRRREMDKREGIRRKVQLSIGNPVTASSLLPRLWPPIVAGDVPGGAGHGRLRWRPVQGGVGEAGGAWVATIQQAGQPAGVERVANGPWHYFPWQHVLGRLGLFGEHS
jgi:hypothetical protein